MEKPSEQELFVSITIITIVADRGFVYRGGMKGSWTDAKVVVEGKFEGQ